VLRRTPFALLVVVSLLTAASAGAWSRHVQAVGASARAQAISVLVPGQAGGATPAISAPGDQVQFSGGFAYGTDPTAGASIVTASSANASVSADSGATSQANASAEVSGLSLFNGEITASSVVAQAHADAHAGAGTGNVNGSTVSGLVALGQAVAPGATVALADWGSLTAVAGGVGGSAAAGYRGSVTGLQIHLNAAHGGLPAGTSIVVGYAEVAAQAAPAPPVKKKQRPKPAAKPGEPKTAPEPTPGLPPVLEPPDITPKLTAGGYVFPVYGPSSFGDTFKAARGDISSGWHHGDDIFAPLGAPVLACASGIVFSVGWNPIGGNRLWLRDGQGNLFYYAHLSAFTPLAVNGNKVNAGDVLGFVGNTGDARTTPYHLHFEIHPVSLLYLGYDGVVNPTSYLFAWQHLQDVSFAGGEAWAPGQSLGNAPKPGAILLSATDISSADGLVPGSLQRAINPAGSRTARADDFSPK
jgi:murein DD-endopeptidase MepM/ murein hydrolase activator NlpD